MRRAIQLLLVASMASMVFGAASDDVWAAQCRPRKAKPPIHLTNMGPCTFEPERLSFSFHRPLVEGGLALVRVSGRATVMSVAASQVEQILADPEALIRPAQESEAEADPASP